MTKIVFYFESFKRRHKIKLLRSIYLPENATFAYIKNQNSYEERKTNAESHCAFH